MCHSPQKHQLKQASQTKPTAVNSRPLTMTSFEKVKSQVYWPSQDNRTVYPCIMYTTVQCSHQFGALPLPATRGFSLLNTGLYDFTSWFLKYINQVCFYMSMQNCSNLKSTWEFKCLKTFVSDPSLFPDLKRWIMLMSLLIWILQINSSTWICFFCLLYIYTVKNG